MRLRRTIFAFICALSLSVAAVALAADEPREGTYKGQGGEVDVNGDGEGKMDLDGKTDCGPLKGSIDLGKAKGGSFEGKRKGNGPGGGKRTTKVDLEATDGGTRLEGALKDGYKGSSDDPSSCSDKLKLDLKLDKDDAFVPARDDGHYRGKNSQDLPVEFDVVREGDDIRIANFEADTEAECYARFETDPQDRIVHVSLPGGKVEPDGSFEIAYEPDEDTSHVIIGYLGGGEASVDLGVTGHFNADGSWNPSSNALDCDSNGDDYKASLVS